MFDDYSGLGVPLPNIGSMDGNTGRSEGATAEKAVPFPCAVLDPIRSFVELRVREPRQGLVAFRHFERLLESREASAGVTWRPAHGVGVDALIVLLIMPALLL